MSNAPVQLQPARFEIARAPDSVRIHMGATLTNIDAADARISAFLEETHVRVDHFAVRILLREAALNAVIHGSGQDPARDVRIDVQLDSGAFVLTVEDDGPGFTWQDRAFTFDLVGDGGRGLALMQMYASSLNFNERGNQVALRCNFRETSGAAVQP